jgi:phenylpropionate dioxygenase-like ring-hydroxylating dioxygenase large terminal subunit
MLSVEDNELICRTGPGTPMGNLFREYWLPACLSSELPAPDSEPVRILLLSEKLCAFRDAKGRPGLIQNHCPHRGASLFFGRNEEGGLRCVYHGWKFSTDGTCVDMPNEPAESDFKQKVKAVAYPCTERGGIVWTYMGPRSAPPPLPDLEWNMLGDESTASAIQQECNYLQSLEGVIDTSHFGFLHRGSIDPATLKGRMEYWSLADRAPHYKVLDTDYGTIYGAYRDADEGREYWRIALFMFPMYTMAPGGTSVGARVPLDDDHNMNYTMSFKGRPPLVSGELASKPEYARWKTGSLPNTSDWYGRWRVGSSMRNDFEIDRAMQRRNAGNNGYTGIVGNMQDQAIIESMGTIYDRSHEHLGTSDAMIIRTRRRLLEAARAFERGVTPPGVDNPEIYRVRSAVTLLPKGVDWLEATRELRTAFTERPTVGAGGAT